MHQKFNKWFFSGSDFLMAIQKFIWIMLIALTYLQRQNDLLYYWLIYWHNDLWDGPTLISTAALLKNRDKIIINVLLLGWKERLFPGEPQCRPLSQRTTSLLSQGNSI